MRWSVRVATVLSLLCAMVVTIQCCSFIVSSVNFEAAGLDLDYMNEFNRRRGPDGTNSMLVPNLAASDSDSDKAPAWTFVHNLLHMTGERTLQPFYDEANGIAVVFNGEIYNYNQLHPNVQDGETYKSDGYCILPTYLASNRSRDFVQRLHGEFAIVLVDFQRGTVTMAADVFSTKPLWYAVFPPDWGGDSEVNRFIAASYESVITRTGWLDVDDPIVSPVMVPPNTVLELEIGTFNIIGESPVFRFDLEQYKTDTADFIREFENAVDVRTRGLIHRAFVGLSDGYDSGSVLLAMCRIGMPTLAYTIKAAEDLDVVAQRIAYGARSCPASIEGVFITPSGLSYAAEKQWVDRNVEEFKYLKSHPSNLADPASTGLSLLLRDVKQRGGLVYMSGGGADEIISDYAVNGESHWGQSCFNGHFPKNLSDVFPWCNFYYGTQRSYLMKEETVAGAHGIEARYPFLDPYVVQEFLWLSADVKNSLYKRPLADYMDDHSFPYRRERKEGFKASDNVVEGRVSKVENVRLKPTSVTNSAADTSADTVAYMQLEFTEESRQPEDDDTGHGMGNIVRVPLRHDDMYTGAGTARDSLIREGGLVYNRTCSIDEGQRRDDCGFPSIEREMCLERGCCWDDTADVWCYEKKVKRLDSQFGMATVAMEDTQADNVGVNGTHAGDSNFLDSSSDVSDSTVSAAATPFTGRMQCGVSDSTTELYDCGFPGIDEFGCVANGCCWKPLTDQPWCYEQPAVVEAIQQNLPMPDDVPYQKWYHIRMGGSFMDSFTPVYSETSEMIDAETVISDVSGDSDSNSSTGSVRSRRKLIGYNFNDVPSATGVKRSMFEEAKHIMDRDCDFAPMRAPGGDTDYTNNPALYNETTTHDDFHAGGTMISTDFRVLYRIRGKSAQIVSQLKNPMLLLVWCDQCVAETPLIPSPMAPPNDGPEHTGYVGMWMTDQFSMLPHVSYNVVLSVYDRASEERETVLRTSLVTRTGSRHVNGDFVEELLESRQREIIDAEHAGDTVGADILRKGMTQLYLGVESLALREGGDLPATGAYIDAKGNPVDEPHYHDYSDAVVSKRSVHGYSFNPDRPVNRSTDGMLMSSSMPQYTVATCTLFRDEDAYLLEWLEYHRCQGVGHFFMFVDHPSDDCYKSILQPYVDAGIVTIDTAEPGTQQQGSTYDKCVATYGHLARWMAFLDVDEFIQTTQHANLLPFLSKFMDKSAIAINWMNFVGTQSTAHLNGFVRENFRFRRPNVDRHFKMIAQPRYIDKCGPHSQVRKADAPDAAHAVNSVKIPNESNYQESDIADGTIIAIAHYTKKSIPHWANKVIKGRINSPWCDPDNRNESFVGTGCCTIPEPPTIVPAYVVRTTLKSKAHQEQAQGAIVDVSMLKDAGSDEELIQDFGHLSSMPCVTRGTRLMRASLTEKGRQCEAAAVRRLQEFAESMPMDEAAGTPRPPSMSELFQQYDRLRKERGST